MSEAEQRIREALAAGPTPGEWQVSGGFNEWTVASDHNVKGKPCISGRQYVASCFRVSKKDTPEYAAMFKANAAYIAACNPAAIRELLAERDALKVENEKLLALERDMSNALPGVYYMDPPDGGDVPIIEQLRRMSRDAARYRYLRVDTPGFRPVVWMTSISGGTTDVLDGEGLDAAIDAALAQAKDAEAR